MSSGGGGNGTSQEVLGNWSNIMQGYWAGPDGQPGRGFLERAAVESGKDYVPYTGERVAPMHSNQTDAIKWASNVAGSGTNLANAGRDQVYRTSNGDYLKNSQGQEYNPFDAGVTPIDRGPEAAGVYDSWAKTNKAASTPTAIGSNAYAGMDSPYYQSLINKGAKDITDQYKQGTEANTTRMMNMAGIFGGGAHQKATEINQNALGDTLANFNAQMGNTQYDRSAGLAEADIGRRMQGGQFDKSLASGAFNQYLDRDTGSQQFNRGLDVGTWNQQRGLQAGAGQFGSGNDQAAMSLYKDLYGFGEKAQGQQQRMDDVAYGNWQDQQGWNKNQLNWLGNALSQAQGTTGAQQVSNYGGGSGVNPFAGAMGVGLLGNSMGWW